MRKIVGMSLASLVLAGLIVFFLSNKEMSDETAVQDSVTEVAEPGSLDTKALAALTRDNGSGIVGIVMNGDTVFWSGAVGLADQEQSVPMRENTRLRIGSVSKLFTAVAALKLIERGDLSLDSSVNELIPELQSDETITVYHLATHTSGIRQYDFSNIMEANNVFPQPDLLTGNRFILSEGPQSAPGSTYTYSSIGYNLLGIVIERVTGKPFDQAVSELVIGPLGLADTVPDYGQRIVERRGRFYTVMPQGMLINTFWRDASDYYPSGGMISTSTDIAHFYKAVFKEGFLNEESLALIMTPAVLADGTVTSRGFGFELHYDETGALSWVGHGGETNGAMAISRYYPDQDLIIAGIANYNFMRPTQNAFDALFRSEIPETLINDQ